MASDKDSSPYGANKGGQIASPNDDSVISSLKRGTANSMPVRHNEHTGSFNRGSSTIETPANESIVKTNKK